MNRYVKDKRPRLPKPVEKIEVSTKHFKLRVVLLIVFIVLAVLGISFGVVYLLKTESGWSTVTVSTTSAHNLSDEFRFDYYFEDRSILTNGEARAVTEKYTALSERAYELFNTYEEHGANVAYINAHANEEVTVDPILYSAFSVMLDGGDRRLFGAPVQEVYNALCSASDDVQAETFDPDRNEEIADFIDRATAFILSAEHVDLKLLGDNRVRLDVSEEYENFAKENAVNAFIDFAHYKNAFVIDYFADELINAGMTKGVLSSTDGYFRVLFDTQSAFDLISVIGDGYYFAANAVYEFAVGGVNLKAITQGAYRSSYSYDDGKTAHNYFDISDGADKCARADLLVFSDKKNCASIAKTALPLFIADRWTTESSQALKDGGLSYVYTDGIYIRYHDPDVSVIPVDDYEEIKFIVTQD